MSVMRDNRVVRRGLAMALIGGVIMVVLASLLGTQPPWNITIGFAVGIAAFISIIRTSKRRPDDRT